ncbi:MAG: DUF99 family protein [Deltaproteobacteria bacterium]|nr:DUF99 family protein [Deltaproteobacteria bacterium]MCW5808158.1 DUF99 family protein [Deltaproteobacteria bacterium]
MPRSFSNVVGFDDSPFPLEHRGDVRVVGAVCARTRLDGVLATTVRRDGSNATDRLVEIVRSSRFSDHIRAVLLQGIALAGFNVVDLDRLHAELDVPVLVVVRKQPRLQMVKDALLDRTHNGAEKWSLIEKHGPCEKLGALWVQRVGLTAAEAGDLLAATTSHGNIPEPLRLAHIIAGGVERGASRGRP